MTDTTPEPTPQPEPVPVSEPRNVSNLDDPTGLDDRAAPGSSEELPVLQGLHVPEVEEPDPRT